MFWANLIAYLASVATALGATYLLLFEPLRTINVTSKLLVVIFLATAVAWWTFPWKIK